MSKISMSARSNGTSLLILLMLIAVAFLITTLLLSNYSIKREIVMEQQKMEQERIRLETQRDLIKKEIDRLHQLQREASEPEVVPTLAKMNQKGLKQKSGITADVEKQNAVRDAMRFAWNGYKTNAWGHDELRPISKTPHNWLDLALTITDGLDTLWIMDLKKEFEEGKTWIRDNLKFETKKKKSVDFLVSVGNRLFQYGVQT